MTAFRSLTTVAVAILAASFLFGEWLQHRHASLAVSRCTEAAQVLTAELRSAGQELCAVQEWSYTTATLSRWGTFSLTVVVLMLALSIWRRCAMEEPLEWLLHQVQRMGVGRWRDSVAKDVASQPLQPPEVAAIADALSELSKRVDDTVVQMETTSRRAALALVSNRAEHRLELVREYLQAVQGMLESATQHQQLVPRQAADNLRFVDREILALKRSMDSEFQDELKRTAPASPANSAPASVRRPTVRRLTTRLRDTAVAQPAAGHTS
ncbi:MAG: hypothetical protein KIT83_09820 [Bryobacterales bacterium]|nr:hypothetical protein [Bryobacterales bacterium]